MKKISKENDFFMKDSYNEQINHLYFENVLIILYKKIPIFFKIIFSVSYNPEDVIPNLVAKYLPVSCDTL